jgi:cob(I)alamin adenosyltransferase
MPKISKVTTRTGDDGTTSLGNNVRVPKDHLRIQAYGAVDELNSIIGLALSVGLDQRLTDALSTIQNTLFHLGSDLAFPQKGGKQISVPRIEQGHVDSLEALIEEILSVVGPLNNFILPGGTKGAAILQFARSICRRAERDLTSLMISEEINSLALVYLNRLSDTLFLMGRYENHVQEVDESLWDSHG